MLFAVKTRSYKYDYHWSWAANGWEDPRASLSRTLEEALYGTHGISCNYQNGSYNILIEGIKALGGTPCGEDFSHSTIRVYLMVAGLSCDQAKSLIAYYKKNEDDPGKAFAGIVAWTSLTQWEVHEDVIQSALDNIFKMEGHTALPEGRATEGFNMDSPYESMLYAYPRSETDDYVWSQKLNGVKRPVEAIPKKKSFWGWLLKK